MPTICPDGFEGPYRLQFWSSDMGEPPHVHVRRDRCDAKYWLDEVELAHNHRFKQHEITRIRALVVKHRNELLPAWNDFFGY